MSGSPCVLALERSDRSLSCDDERISLTAKDNYFLILKHSGTINSAMRGCKQPVHNAERTRPPTGNTYSQRQLKSRAPLNRLAQHILALITQTIQSDIHMCQGGVSSDSRSKCCSASWPKIIVGQTAHCERPAATKKEKSDGKAKLRKATACALFVLRHGH